MRKSISYASLTPLSEDDRVALIAETVRDKRLTIGVTVEDTEKADRYMKKLRAIYPGVVEMARINGPVPGCVTLKLGPPSVLN